MDCSIFIRSYAKDFQWLHYCLRCIRKNIRGFREVVIHVDEDDREAIKSVDTSSCIVRSDWKPQCSNGYLDQQIAKIYADTYCEGEYIWYVDSDRMIHIQTSPDDLCIDGKPAMLYQPYSTIGHDAAVWRKPTSDFVGAGVTHEFMRRLPVYHRSHLCGVRNFCKQKHGVDVGRYVARLGTFSEFNAIGAWIYHLSGTRDKYTWIDSSKPGFPQERMVGFHSWSGISREAKKRLDELSA